MSYLSVYYMAQNRRAIFYNRGRRFVAATFYTLAISLAILCSFLLALNLVNNYGALTKFDQLI